MTITITDKLREHRHAAPKRSERTEALALVADWKRIAQLGRDLLIPNRRHAAVAAITKVPVDQLGADQVEAQKAAYDGDPAALQAMDRHLAAEHKAVEVRAAELLSTLSRRYAEAIAGEVETARAALLPTFTYHEVPGAVDATPVISALLAEQAVQANGGRADFRGGSPAGSFLVFGLE